jgi:hypothetical protein
VLVCKLISLSFATNRPAFLLFVQKSRDLFWGHASNHERRLSIGELAVGVLARVALIIRAVFREAKAVWLVAACTGLLSFAGCADKEPGSSTNQAASSGSSDSSNSSGAFGCDVPGEFRCNPDTPEVLELCDPSTVLGWSEFLRCGAPELCDADGEQCLICSPGSYRCDGWRLQRCSEAGSHWQLADECPSEDYCDSAQGRCLRCLNGEGFCDEENLFSCNASQDAFQLHECPSKDLCNVSSMSCRACFPGEYQCSTTQLMRCDDQQTWQPADTCATDALCVATVALLTDSPDAEPSCIAPACEAGEFRCNPDFPTHLEGCPPSRAGYDLIDICDQAPLCDAIGGTCLQGCGVPGTYRCNGMALQHCDLDGINWVNDQICNTAEECNVAKKDCARCSPGDFQCNDNLLQQCGDDRTWTTLEICASASLCQIDSAASEQHCGVGCGAPGTFRCDGTQLEACALDGVTWQLREVCESAGLCNPVDGRCTPAGCPTAGLVVCQGQSLRQCRDDLSGWDELKSCADGTLCDIATSDCTVACPDVAVRCNGAQPERCVTGDQGPAWEAAQTPCASFGLCAVDAVAETVVCNEPVCGGTLPDYRCAGASIEQCNMARTAFEPYRVCAAQTTCDVGVLGDGPPQCDVCVANEFECAGNGDLQRCSADGQVVTSVQACRDASHCATASDGTQGYCLVCDPGETRCNAGNLETCSDDRLSWVGERVCDMENGCHDGPGAADYCNECPSAGEASCNGTGALHTCSADQLSWSADVTCQFGCQMGSGGADYCRECSPNSAECSTSDPQQRRMCSAIGKWEPFVDCPDGSTCADRGTSDFCGMCAPNTFTCTSETERQGCTSAGTPGSIAACPAETPYCLNGNCVPCREGDDPQCPSGVGSQDRKVCSTDGQWVTEVCPYPTGICSEGDCVACLPGSAQCTGASGGGRTACVNGQMIVANCVQPGQTACLNGACVACNPNVDRPRCTASGGREFCNSQGQWQSQNCGGNTAVCVAGVCQQCNPATQSAQCVASQGTGARQICNNGSWQNQACADPTPVCTGQGQCVCEGDAYRCGPTGTRQQCVNQVWTDEQCESGSCDEGECVGCLNSDDCTSELPVCDDGACVCADESERCMGTTHQVCDDGTWRTDVCPEETPLCDMSTGSCQCQSGGERCEDDVLQTCIDGEWVNNEGEPSCAMCDSNEDCSGTTPICDGSCVACSGDNCPIGLTCAASGACVQCTTSDSSECPPEAPVCSSQNECVECTSSADDKCAGDTPVCSSEGKCVGCTENDECGGGQVCDLASGSCVTCTVDNPGTCPDDAPVCTADNRCVECAEEGDCATGHCDALSNSCVECTEDDHCPADTPSCDETTHQCTGCTMDEQCSDSTVCSNGTCVACTSTNTTRCDAETPACQNNVCVQCTASENEVCVDEGQVCKVETNTCVECIDDVQCPGQVCDISANVCTDCEDGSLCPNALVCVAGACVPCVPQNDAGISCPDGFTCSDEGECI